jgi:glycosyltransferase involved in cell wall biosynthesis
LVTAPVSLGEELILIISPSAYVLSGLATWLDRLLPELPALGWRPILGLVEGPIHHRPEIYLASHPAAEWVAIRCSTGTAVGRRMAVERAIRTVKPHLVVGVNVPDAYVAIRAMRVAGERSPRVAMSLHSVQPDLYDDLLTFAPILDGVIATNRLNCALAARIPGIDAGRVHYAPCGVSVGDEARVSVAGPLRLAYVGRLDEDEKRVSDVAAVARRLHASGTPFRLTIAGDGPAGTSLRAALDDLVDLGIVSFRGTLHADDVSSLYGQVDVLLITSPRETGPIVAWEALARGVAVVSARYLGIWREGALIDGVTALTFDVGDCASAAARIAQLAREPSLRQRLAAAGQAMVRSRYSLAASGRAWAVAFAQVCAADPLPSPSSTRVAPAAGRLDRLLGRRWAEVVRQRLPRSVKALNAGGEWPHSYGGTSMDAPEFWAEARRLDVTA